MAHLSLQAAAIEHAVDGLLDLFVVVCDAEGELVERLSAEDFSCIATMREQSVALQNEGAVEQAPGCYRLSFFHAPTVETDLLVLSARRRVRANPAGLAAVHAVVAEGHALVRMQRAHLHT
jgi:hypothetical protein